MIDFFDLVYYYYYLFYGEFISVIHSLGIDPLLHWIAKSYYRYTHS
jgi:hypothetical protein